MRALVVLYCVGRGVTRDPAQAMAWYGRGAAGGDPEAMTRIGEAYYTGDGVPKSTTLSREWLQRGATAGNPRAQRRLAMPALPE
jgi:TPR repeat protein